MSHRRIQLALLLALWKHNQDMAILMQCAALLYAYIEEDMGERRVRPTRVLYGCGLQLPHLSVWKTVDNDGDDLAMLHFLAFNRNSFEELASITSEYITMHPLCPSTKQDTVSETQLRRRVFDHHDILAMTLYLLGN